MPTPEQGLVAALAVAVAVTGAIASARAARRLFGPGDSPHATRDRRVTLVVLAGALAALAARVALVKPVLIHANFHGAALVDEILAFPSPADHRAEYGQGSFFVLGALVRLAGGGFGGVVAVNQLLAVATLVVLGVLAARLAHRPWAAPLAVLLGALDPALMRVAASEDAHVLATFLTCVALLGLDVAARARDPAALVCGGAAALLALWTRQTVYPVVALAAGLAFARADPATRRWLGLRATLALVAIVLAARVVQTALHPTDAVTLRFLPVIVADRFISLFAGHPVLDPRAAPALLPLGALGLVALRRHRGGLVLAAGVIAQLLITLPFAFPTPGVELSFRLPALALWLIPAAAGASLLPGLVTRPRACAFAVVALALLPPAQPAFATVRATTAATEEMLALRALRDDLPPQAVFTVIPTHEPTPTVRLPLFALPRDAMVERPSRGRAGAANRLFVVGLQCRARSFAELAPGAGPAQLLARDFRHGAGDDVAVPGDLRPECRALLAGATRVSRVVPIVAPDDPPFAFFGAASTPVTVAVWRIGSAAEK